MDLPKTDGTKTGPTQTNTQMLNHAYITKKSKMSSHNLSQVSTLIR